MSWPRWFLLCALPLASVAWVDPPPSSEAIDAPPLVQEAPPQASLATAQAHWSKRGDVKHARATIDALEQVLAAQPDDVEALVLLARATYYVASVQRSGDAATQKAWHKRGYEAGKHAAELDPKRADALFWSCTNLGLYGKLDGIWKSASSYGEIRATLDKVEALDPSYFYGGLWRYWGQLIDQVPSALRAMYGYDLDDAEGFYKRAIGIEPRYLQSYIYLGQLYLQMDRPEEARAAFQHVADADPTALPAVTPENTIFKAQARSLLAERFPAPEEP